MDWIALFAILIALAIAPIAIAYGRRLDDWRMIAFWLCLAIPVAGWFAAMWIALTAPRKPSHDSPPASP